MRRLLAYASLLFAFAGLAAPLQAAAASTTYTPFNSICSQPQSKGSTVCVDSKNTSNPISGPNSLILNITNLIAFIAGIAAIVVIIVSGIKYVISNGDSNAINSAKQTLIYAIVGIVVIVAARAIIGFVISKI